MILYHGSFLEIAKPDLVHSRPNVDFGRGFYVTPLYEQAAKWCGKFIHRGKDGIISRYEYDEIREAELKTLKFVPVSADDLLSEPPERLGAVFPEMQNLWESISCQKPTI